MEGIVNSINGVLWSDYVIYILLGVGLLFSILTRFLQVRHIKEMARLMFKGEKSAAGISSFQALSIALSGRIGTGNIAGVATAIFYGGPGAIFWMWVIAFIGSASAFIESTLAQIYKTKQDGEYRGGPAYYIEKGLGWKWFAILFALASILAMAVLQPGVQANAIAEGLDNAFGINPILTGGIIAILLALVIFGGTKRIASTATVVVPIMALGYMLLSLYVMIINITELPAVISLIVRSAFALDSAFGGILGMAIAWGVKRGIYSNEAGQGTGAHAAAAAEVSHPAKQGLVQAASVYIDTLFVCSATAFMILFTGMYNTQGADGSYIVHNVGEMEPGPGYTQAAIDSILPGFGAGFIAIALLFFAFTTIMALYYIAETNLGYLTRRKKGHVAKFILKLVTLTAVFTGTMNQSKLAWAMGDIGVGLMIWVNIIAILFLAKPALLALKDYEKQRKLGIDPVFSPKALGIKNADYWEFDYTKQENQSSTKK